MSGDASVHGQFDGFLRRFDPLDSSCFFNNAGEHNLMLQVAGCRLQVFRATACNIQPSTFN
jgi:hypothetical protein